MQVSSPDTVEGPSQLWADIGCKIHWLCQFRQHISDTGSPEQTKTGFFLCLLALGVGEEGDSEDRKRFSVFVKGAFRLISCIFKNTYIIHIHKDDVNMYMIRLKKTQCSFNRALCSAPATGISDCKCNSHVWMKHLHKPALGSPWWRLQPFFSQWVQAHAGKSFFSYPTK